MKYSKMIIRDKAADNRKSKIEQMENTLSISMERSTADALAAEKKKYVQDVVGVPEFDLSISHIMQHTLEKGSETDKADITLIVDKIQSKGLDYDDLGKLEDICDNNFKYLFQSPPERHAFDATSIWGAVLTVCAIGFRVSYQFVDSDTLIVFLTLINIVAIMYTFIDWNIQVVDEVDIWLRNNNMPSEVGGNIISSISRQMRNNTICFCVAVLILYVFSLIFNFFALANDIVTIVSLGISILSNRIIKFFSLRFEWNVYHNK